MGALEDLLTHHHNQLKQEMERLMSQLSDDVTALVGVVGEAITLIQSQNQKITDLENTIAQGDPADQAADQQVTQATASLQAVLPAPVPEALVLAPSGDQTLPVGQAASFSVSPVSGGTAPYTVAVSGLPDGLTSDASGNVTGTPTTAGASAVTVNVTDSGDPQQSTVGNFNITVQ